MYFNRIGYYIIFIYYIWYLYMCGYVLVICYIIYINIEKSVSWIIIWFIWFNVISDK